MVVVDVTHKQSRKSIDNEVIKALHFFKEKDSILVLNKVDALSKSRIELLRITRVLTDGIVSGKCSHLDAFHDRKMKRLELEKTNELRCIEAKNIIFERLPQCAHEAANNYIGEINRLSCLGTIHETPSYVPSLPAQQLSIGSGSQVNELDPIEAHNQIILKAIEDQMMMSLATKEEIAIRRHNWLCLSRKLNRVKSWQSFSDVYMVSSLTGEGIANLRMGLLKRAKPGLWAYNPELITDQEPSRIVKMAFWTHALDYLPKETYNKLKIRISDCEIVEKSSPNAGQKVFCHLEILCETERQIKQILGMDSRKIRKLSFLIENELADYFDLKTTVKISLIRKGLPGHVKNALSKAENFEEVFPSYEDNFEDAGF